MYVFIFFVSVFVLFVSRLLRYRYGHLWPGSIEFLSHDDFWCSFLSISRLFFVSVSCFQRWLVSLYGQLFFFLLRSADPGLCLVCRVLVEVFSLFLVCAVRYIF